MASKKPAKKGVTKKATAKKPASTAGKKTAPAKKAAAKKAPAKKAAKKAEAQPRKRPAATGPYAQNNPAPRQHVEEPAPMPTPVAQNTETVDIILEKPSWRSRLVAVFKK